MMDIKVETGRRLKEIFSSAKSRHCAKTAAVFLKGREGFTGLDETAKACIADLNTFLDELDGSEAVYGVSPDQVAVAIDLAFGEESGVPKIAVRDEGERILENLEPLRRVPRALASGM